MCRQSMTSENSSSRSQTGFFSESGELGGSHARFTEVCTALYERELLALSHLNTHNASVLKRRIGGLPYHIRSVARFMVTQPQSSSPLKVDTHNGSWYEKQPSKCPGLTQDDEKCVQWFKKNTDYGLVVPVLVQSIEGIAIELDSIDKFRDNKEGVHLNKHGWFDIGAGQVTKKLTPQNTFDSQPNDEMSEGVFPSPQLSSITLTLLKPTKAIMSSACCGHMWNYKSKTSPRSLSMREMRLSTHLNWKNFTSNRKAE